MNPYLAIGQVVKPQGVRGEVKIIPVTPDPNRFLDMVRVLLQGKGGSPVPYQIVSARVTSDAVYLTLSGVDSREAAEALRGMMVMVPREEALPPGESAWYIADLVGCSVSDDEGRALGKLTEVLQHGAADVWVIEGERNMMVPALKRAIAKVDVAARSIVLVAKELPAIAVVEGEGEEA